MIIWTIENKNIKKLSVKSCQMTMKKKIEKKFNYALV